MSLLKRLNKVKDEQRESQERVEERQGTPVVKQDPYRDLKIKIHKQVIEELDKDLDENRDEPLENEKINREIEHLVLNMIELEAGFISRADRNKLVSEIIDEVMGFGPIIILHPPDH